MNSLNSNSSNSVHLVIQRYRSCKILLNETEWVTQGGRATKGGGITLEGQAVENIHEAETISNIANDSNHHHHHHSTHCGLLIYVSFAKNINAKSCWEAAETCCNVPILTNGLWGDTTSELFSLKQILTITTTTITNDDISNHMKCKNSVLPQTSVTIVPQANLICTMKRHGTSIQYHNQVSKEDGRDYYDLFVNYIRANIYEYYYIRTKQDIPPSLLEWKLQSMTTTTTTTTTETSPEITKMDPSIPPMDIFRTSTTSSLPQLLYGSFDPNTGLPITDIHNIPLTKSALKKLRKIQDVHRTKHEKWLQQQQSSSIPTSQSTATDRNDDNTGIVSTTNTTSTITAIPSTPSIADREEPFLLLKSSSSSCPPPPVPNETSPFPNPSWMYDNDIVVAGTFGKRQGLEIVSDMGPFCHNIQI